MQRVHPHFVKLRKRIAEGMRLAKMALGGDGTGRKWHRAEMAPLSRGGRDRCVLTKPNPLTQSGGERG